MIKFLHLKFLLAFLITAAFGVTAIAQTSVAEYYQSTIGKTGGELKTALHGIIRNHTELPYTSSEYDVWDALDEADEDPNNSNNVILIYTGRSEAKSHKDDGTSDGDAWNREHIWAKSHGDFGTDPGAGTDIHHLRACDKSVNADRNNRFFDNGGIPHNEATECKFDNDDYTWEPRDAVKGDIARMILYMAVCYEGENGDPDLEMTNNMSLSTVYDKSSLFGKLSTLIIWNAQDPVDNFEKARNEKVYTIQGNRNPFIDHPEWADEIWTTSIDTQSPVITELSPSNESTGTSLTANLIIKFNEDIKEGSGSVTIKRYADDSVFETLTIPNVRLSFSNNQLLINPEAQFEEGTKYYVVIENGVITDVSSNTFEGISNKATWNFTTSYSPPTIVGLYPADDRENVSVNADLEITFSKDVQAGNGSILVLNEGNTIMEVSASNAAVTYIGTQVNIDLPNDLETGTEYYITIDNNAFKSTNGVPFVGISSTTAWSFRTEIPTGIEDLFADGIPSFYPNPATIEIKLTNMDEVESLHISNLTGRNIMEVKSPSTRISLSNLPKGMYFVTFVTFDGKRVTKKLLKQ